MWNMIADSRNGGTLTKISRTYKTTDGAARLHVTTDRKIWLDYTGGSGGNMTHVGDLPTDEPMTRANVRRAANH